jgi:hypothetical protein
MRVSGCNCEPGREVVLPSEVGPRSSRDGFAKLIVAQGDNGLFQLTRERNQGGHGTSLPRVRWTTIALDGADMKSEAAHGYAPFAQPSDELVAQER